MEKLGQNLRDLRVARGKSKADLAKQAGMSEEYLRLIEVGKKLPSAKVLLNLCKALPVPLSEGFAIKTEFLRLKFAEDSRLLLGEEEVSTFATLFVNEIKPYVSEVMTEAEMPPERRVENTNYLLGVVHYVLKKITGQDKEGEGE